MIGTGRQISSVTGAREAAKHGVLRAGSMTAARAGGILFSHRSDGVHIRQNERGVAKHRVWRPARGAARTGRPDRCQKTRGPVAGTRTAESRRLRDSETGAE